MSLRLQEYRAIIQGGVQGHGLQEYRAMGYRDTGYRIHGYKASGIHQYCTTPGYTCTNVQLPVLPEPCYPPNA